MSAPTVEEASRLVARLGFLVVGEEDRSTPGDHTLLVALRDRPTFEHFDPELVTYWRTGADRRGHPDQIVRGATPGTQHFSWGKIEVVDRLSVENLFVTLGGDLTIAEPDATTTLAIFDSPGPILRMGGHSQDYDAISTELGAFFARIMVPIDFEPGAEDAVSAASPLDRYAAFIAYEAPRFGRSADLQRVEVRDAQVLGREARRLQHEQPDAWRRGGELLVRLGLA